ncbi:PAS domain S-box protein [Haladaptatus sp. QDMS2]|uniref:PAS domain S-box protein n=2 Tax=unclassified Haladaptatus TaxID=2622732 RepID=UPI0023E7D65D|nr:PAS domain S-box protein [Haladaptatus sp. QDMS2]
MNRGLSLRASEELKQALSVWIIGGTGIVLAGFEIWHAIQMQTLLGRIIEAGLPLVMAFVIVSASYWLSQSEFSESEMLRIAGWFILGLIGMAVVTGWIISHQIIRGVGFHHWHFVTASSMTVGGMAGFLIGVYDGKRRDQHREAERAQQAIGASMDGIAILNEKGEYESVNQAHAEVYGYDDPGVFIGKTWHICYTEPEVERVEEEVMPQLSAEGRWRGELTGLRRDGSTFPQELTLSLRPDGGLICVVRDATERKEREQQLATREQRLRTIVENVPVILFAVDRNHEITLQVGKGLDDVGVEQNQMVGESINDVFDNSPEVIDAIDRSFDGEAVDITIDLWERTYQVWYEPIANGGQITNVIGVAMDVTERDKRERGIRALHDATRKMMQATDRETICQISVDSAQNALGLSMSAIWLHADDEPQLEPVALSDRARELFGGAPTFEPGNSIAWQVYESGEPRVFNDISREANRFNPETKLRGELIVPIAEYGVLTSGSTDPGRFNEADVMLAQLLAANTRSALDRAEREAALQRQTDQMEFFNSILRHDVLNGMTVIRGRAEFLTEELEGEQLRDAQTVVRWSDDVITIVQRVRKVLEALTGTGDPQLESVDLSAVLHSEVDRIQATYPDVTFETDIPEAVNVKANDLLGEVLGNVITNAVDHNDTDGLRVSLAVDEERDDTDEFVTVRIADNGCGVPDESKEAIFRRDETGHAKSTGSGFGLFFVDSMVAEYGGDIWVEDNDPHGAVFMIKLLTPSQ